jgi:hypothetical protein
MKMYSRAPLFEEPFAQTLSGKKKQTGDFATTKPKKTHEFQLGFWVTQVRSEAINGGPFIFEHIHNHPYT